MTIALITTDQLRIIHWTGIGMIVGGAIFVVVPLIYRAVVVKPSFSPDRSKPPLPLSGQPARKFRVTFEIARMLPAFALLGAGAWFLLRMGRAGWWPCLEASALAVLTGQAWVALLLVLFSMRARKAVCPECGRPAGYPWSEAGRDLRCRACGVEFCTSAKLLRPAQRRRRRIVDLAGWVAVALAALAFLHVAKKREWFLVDRNFPLAESERDWTWREAFHGRPIFRMTLDDSLRMTCTRADQTWEGELDRVRLCAPDDSCEKAVRSLLDRREVFGTERVTTVQKVRPIWGGAFEPKLLAEGLALYDGRWPPSERNDEYVVLQQEAWRQRVGLWRSLTPIDVSPEVVRHLSPSPGDRDDAWRAALDHLRREDMRRALAMCFITDHARDEWAMLDYVPSAVAALTSADPGVREGAYWALCAMSTGAAPRAVQGLLPLLAHREPHVRAAAAKALGVMDREAFEAVPTLLKMLRDPDRSVQSEAAIAIHKLRYDWCFPPGPAIRGAELEEWAYLRFLGFGKSLEEIIRLCGYNVAVVTVAGVSGSPGANGDPPQVELKNVDMLRGDGFSTQQPSKVYWAIAFNEDWPTRDSTAQDLARWKSRPLQGPTVGDRLIVVGRRKSSQTPMYADFHIFFYQKIPDGSDVPIEIHNAASPPRPQWQFIGPA